MNNPVLPSLSNEGLCFVIYAPFGDDHDLANFPDGATGDLLSHPLVLALKQVARQGVAVVALIDRVGEESWLLDVPPGAPERMRLISHWKLDMGAAATLAGLLRTSHEHYPERELLLCMEGHGSGYLPAIDKAGLFALAAQQSAGIQWHVSGVDQAPFDAEGKPVLVQGVPSWVPGMGTPQPSGGPVLPSGGPVLPSGGPVLPSGGPVLPSGGPVLPSGGPVLPSGGPVLPSGGPVLPSGGPVLPGGAPSLPIGHTALPTYTLGRALDMAAANGVPTLCAIHFANCFNLSVELLHTVAPYARAASGYANENFFTGGASYPAVFERLAQAGGAAPPEVAAWFVEENHRQLSARGRHPLVGGALALSRMEGITAAVDDLADALLVAMRNANTQSPSSDVRRVIQSAIEDAQQYDTSGDLRMDGPDQLTDLYSLADALSRQMSGWPEVQEAAAALGSLLQGIKRVGDVDAPWMDASAQTIWDFTEPTLAMNIFLPDPLRSGLWDWRAPFYVDINPGPGPARMQTGVIDFLKVTNWVEFLQEYHRDTPFHALSVPRRITSPVAQAHVEPVSTQVMEAHGLHGRRRRVRPNLGPVAQHVASLRAKVLELDE